MKARFFRTSLKMGRFSCMQGWVSGKLSPMIGKSFLGASLKFLIGKLKLSYRKVSTIIGESLAAVRRGLWRGYLFGIFFSKICDEIAFFLCFFSFLCRYIFACL